MSTHGSPGRRSGHLLTEAEMRALRAYVAEETIERAALALGLSRQTLKNHLGTVYKKLGVRKAHSAIYRLALLQGFDPLAQNQPTIVPMTADTGIVRMLLGEIEMAAGGKDE